jgi:putative sterol carrier protein
MHHIKDYITEPRFKQMMVELSKAQSEEEVDTIISKHNKPSMTDEEKARYSENVIADMERYMAILDKDIDQLRASTI